MATIRSKAIRQAAYYNEIDPFAADWLESLIKSGLIADGVVDRRSIVDVDGDDLAEFNQCHFFAGIGGWSYALRLSGWPDDKPVWTGSCPCQPFSSAGKRKGVKDRRHLWPDWNVLIAQCRPPVVFGEQVASPLGRDWLSAVRTDLEALEYEVGAADLCAAGTGAPHLRQRLYWVGITDSTREGKTTRLSSRTQSQRTRSSGRLGVPYRSRVNAPVHGLRQGRQSHDRIEALRPSAASRPWSEAEWVRCADNRSRPVEPGTFPLAHGISARVGRIRGYGNAIVPQIAAEFIQAAVEASANV